MTTFSIEGIDIDIPLRSIAHESIGASSANVSEKITSCIRKKYKMSGTLIPDVCAKAKLHNINEQSVADHANVRGEWLSLGMQRFLKGLNHFSTYVQCLNTVLLKQE